MFNMDNTIKFFLVCDDGRSACVGPFNSPDEVEAHRRFLEDRGDADPVGHMISVESMSDLDFELASLGYPEGCDLYVSPAEDRAEDYDHAEAREYDGDNMSDVEADADTLASAGYGTDEDYGCFGGEDY